MLDYLVWMDNEGFWIRDAWDAAKNQMGSPGKMILFPRQRRILGHALTMNDAGDFPYQDVLYSDIKKTGKTVISSSVAAWYMETARPGTEVFIIANSQEQGAGRVFRDLTFHFQKRQEQFGKKYGKIGEYRIDLPNGTFCQVLSNSFRSAAGSRHALTLWDELWGSVSEIDRRLWDEMVPVPTVPNSLRFISSYAGFENESELLWEQYLRGVGPDENQKGQGQKIEGLEDLPCWRNGDMFCYWSHESDLPWYTEEYLDKQQRTERPSAFLRLFMNQWVTSHEEFVPVEWYKSATEYYINSATLWADHPFRWWPITVGIDAGIKRDCTALVAVGYDASRGKLGLVHHRIWTPSPGDPVDLEATVETELRMLRKNFNVASIVYDPTHLLTIMTKLGREGFPTRTFEQTASNMTAASQLLYDVMKNRNFEAYPSEDLQRHVQMAVAENNSRGFRIVKSKVSARHHVDGAIALAMAAHDAVSNGGVDISRPVVIVSPFSDMTRREKTDNEIPFPLRT